MVTWLGAVQSQDYAGAKWALGMRSPGVTDAEVDELFNSGAILRTHVMRPTWHFVSPKDICWLLKLTAPRVHAFNAHYYRRMELDDALFARSDALLAKALEGGKQLTRKELHDTLQREGIATVKEDNTVRLGLIMMHAELEGIICSGERRGKQFTYALMEERAPRARELERDEALAELTLRYFRSHGPAMVKDFTWWSGLTVADAKAGIEMVKSRLESETVDGRTYWSSAAAKTAEKEPDSAYLLPNFDEYLIGYTDHTSIFDGSYADVYDSGFPHSIVVDGKVMGAWKRTLKKDEAEVTAKLFTPLSGEQKDALDAAAEEYSRFLGLPVVLS